MSQSKQKLRRLVGQEGLRLSVDGASSGIFLSQKDLRLGAPTYSLREDGITYADTGFPVRHGDYSLQLAAARYPRAHGQIQVGNQYRPVVLRVAEPSKEKATGNKV